MLNDDVTTARVPPERPRFDVDPDRGGVGGRLTVEHLDERGDFRVGFRTVDGEGDPVEPCPRPIAPDFKPEEVPIMMKGVEFSRRQLLQEIRAIDLPALGLTFGLPMFFFHGTHDHYTPMELAERYCASILAPHKEFVRFEGCHHFVAMNRPVDFLRELVTRVWPIL